MPPAQQLMSSGTRRTLLLGFVLLATAGAVNGQALIYDNLASSSDGVRNWSGIFKVGQSFTPDQSATVASLTLNLGTTNGTATPVFDVELWSHNAGTGLPSALLATFVDNSPWLDLYASAIDASKVVSFASGDFFENYSVAADTTYWLVISSTSGSAKYWGVSSAVGSGSATFSSSTPTWSTLSATGAMGAQIALSTVPEPASIALGAGLLIFGFAWFRRRSAVRQKAR